VRHLLQALLLRWWRLPALQQGQALRPVRLQVPERRQARFEPLGQGSLQGLQQAASARRPKR